MLGRNKHLKDRRKEQTSEQTIFSVLAVHLKTQILKQESWLKNITNLVPSLEEKAGEGMAAAQAGCCSTTQALLPTSFPRSGAGGVFPDGWLVSSLPVL